METKSLYEYKTGSVKTKYKRKIEALEQAYLENPIPKSTLEELKKECDTEINTLKKQKQETITHFAKAIRLCNLFADLILLIAVLLLIFGFYRLNKDLGTKWMNITATVAGGIFFVSTIVLFAICSQKREERSEYLKDAISDSELISTKSLVHEFIQSHE